MTARATETFTVAQPAGFDALLAEQEQIVDIYYDDALRGQATVIVKPGVVRFTDADALVALLPDIADREAVREKLATSVLPANTALLCERPDSRRTTCGRLPDDVTGILYDARRFRVDIFVAQRLRSVTDATGPRYLNPSSTGMSAIYRLSGTISGSGDDLTTAVQSRIVVARGNARLRTEFTYADDIGFLSDTVAGEIDQGGLRYRAGAMWAPGLDLLGQRKILGVGLTTQVDTRADRDVLTGTPLVVSLFQRAQVDIFRDGRLLSSQIYEAGNRALDTSALPDGSYAVVLRIQEAGGAVREVNRFFSKDALIPATRERFYFAYAGLLAGDRAGRFLNVSHRAFANLGMAQRLNPHVVVEGKMALTGRAGVVEAGGLLLNPLGQARLSAMVSTRGDRGLIAQAGTNGTGRLNMSLDLRRIWSNSSIPVLPYGNELFQDGSISRYEQLIRQPPASYVQASAQMTYQIGSGQIGGIATYRRFGSARSYYTLGPTVYLPVISRGGLQLALRGDLSFARRGHSGYVGVSLTRAGPSLSYSAVAGVRGNDDDRGRRGTNAVGGAGIAWQGDDVLGGTLGLAANIDHDRFGTNLGGRADLKTAPVALYAQAVHPLSRGQPTQYSANFTTALVAGGGRIGLDGRNLNDSALVVAVDGPPGGTRFDVLVNGASRGSISAGQTLTIAVPAYRQYQVRVRASGDTLMHFDSQPRNVSTFPGTVATLHWSARAVAAIFGRLVWPDGTPVTAAALTTADGIGETDGTGFFQIESANGADVTARTADGRACSVRLSATPVDGYADVGTLTCLQPLPVNRIAGTIP